MKTLAAALSAALFALPAWAEPIPSSFTSSGQDRSAIEALLADYTMAVSTKNEAMFRSLLLDTHIPFSSVGLRDPSDRQAVVTTNYDSFRTSVFQGAPFTQRFQDVHIEQDGRLASVSLVFINTAADGKSWGWKTLQLLKLGGHWKIASEFYTGHAG